MPSPVTSSSRFSDSFTYLVDDSLGGVHHRPGEQTLGSCGAVQISSQSASCAATMWAGHHTVEEDTSTEQRLRRGPVHPLVEPFLKFVV